jgi:hypothetical protein
LHSAAGREWSDAFEARYQAARRDADLSHLREQARFLLEVRGDALAALQLAQDNWRVQREPADVHIFLAAAAATGRPAAAEPVREWIRQVHYEDHTLSAAVASR